MDIFYFKNKHHEPWKQQVPEVQTASTNFDYFTIYLITNHYLLCLDFLNLYLILDLLLTGNDEVSDSRLVARDLRQ